MSADPIRDHIDNFAAAVEAIKQGKRNGTLNWNGTARAYRVSLTTLRRHCDPEFHERDNARRAARKREQSRDNKLVSSLVAADRTNPRDIAARLKEIPKYDGRTLTGRICGDPNPLDRRRSTSPNGGG